MQASNKKRLGIIGGLGPLAGADILFKIIKATPASQDKEHFDLIFEQHPFDDGAAVGDHSFKPSARKFHVFNMIRELEHHNAKLVVLNCFISHTFLDELESETKIPIVNMLEAIRHYVIDKYPKANKLGILTSNFVRKKKLFEAYFDATQFELLYPSPEIQNTCVMRAVYGSDGIKAGFLRGKLVDRIERACSDLIAQGAEIIIPGFSELPVVLSALPMNSTVPVLDSNQVYAEYAIRHGGEPYQKEYKIGIVGGVGPAATVDFMDKIVRRTKAGKDQDHIKLVVEQNPQIPDRTENLVGDGPDPTIPLYAACKRLQDDDADLIAIPCNTAHAFVERLQSYLSVPVVNMVYEVVEEVEYKYTGDRIVGLLATTGTIDSRVYHDVAAKKGIHLIVPDPENQDRVMEAIYGNQGVKAGRIDGECRALLEAAIEHLMGKGAKIIILGCTELPLVFAQSNTYCARQSLVKEEAM